MAWKGERFPPLLDYRKRTPPQTITAQPLVPLDLPCICKAEAGDPNILHMASHPEKGPSSFGAACRPPVDGRAALYLVVGSACLSIILARDCVCVNGLNGMAEQDNDRKPPPRDTAHHPDSILYSRVGWMHASRWGGRYHRFIVIDFRHFFFSLGVACCRTPREGIPPDPPGEPHERI